MNNIQYYNANTPDIPQYMKLSKSILAHAAALGMDLDAVWLYMLLVTRTQLSGRNGLAESDGRIYIYYTRDDVMSTCGWSKRKTIDAFRTLCSAGLIREVDRTNKNGCTIAKKIYVKQWTEPSAMLSLEDIRKGKLNDITIGNYMVNPDYYYQIPSGLSDERLNVRARILYAIIIDMLKLSIKTGRIDKNGAPWCELTNLDLCHLLQCRPRTLAGTYGLLDQCGLTYRYKAEYGAAARIFAVPVWDCDSSADNEPHTGSHEHPNHADTAPQSCSNGDPNHAGTAPQNGKNSTQVNPIDLNIPTTPDQESLTGEDEFIEDMSYQNDGLLDMRKLQADMGKLLQPAELSTAEEIIQTIAVVLAADAHNKCACIQIGHDWVPMEQLREHYALNDRYIVDTMITKIVPVWGKVLNRKSYVRKALFQAFEKHCKEAFFTRRRLEAA